MTLRRVIRSGKDDQFGQQDKEAIRPLRKSDGRAWKTAGRRWRGGR